MRDMSLIWPVKLRFWTVLSWELKNGLLTNYHFSRGNRKIELQEVSPKISEEETNASVMADLHQRQEIEFDLKVHELQGKVR